MPVSQGAFLRKKANRLVWIGVSIGLAVNAVQTFVDSPHYWGPILEIAQLPALAFCVWGSTLALRAKDRSLWWLVLLLPFTVNGIAGLTMVAVIFALQDKTPQTIEPALPIRSES